MSLTNTNNSLAAGLDAASSSQSRPDELPVSSTEVLVPPAIASDVQSSSNQASVPVYRLLPFWLLWSWLWNFFNLFISFCRQLGKLYPSEWTLCLFVMFLARTLSISRLRFIFQALELFILTKGSRIRLQTVATCRGLFVTSSTARALLLPHGCLLQTSLCWLSGSLWILAFLIIRTLTTFTSLRSWQVT